MVSIPEDNDVDRSWLLGGVLSIEVLLDEHVRLSLGGSENESSEPLNFSLINDSSDVLDVDRVLVIFNQSKVLLSVVNTGHMAVLNILSIHLVSKLSGQLGDHHVGNFENL